VIDDLTFGDSEPEDAWDAGDSVDELVANLIRRAVLLDDHTLIPRGNPVVTLRALADLVRRARQRRLTERELVRADQLDEDITFLQDRV